MKTLNYIMLFILCVMAVSCDYDNYDGPNAQLTGNLVYKGEPLNVSAGEIAFQLYEPGWQLTATINNDRGVKIAQEGSFSALIFNGNYKLIMPKNQGPFMNITNTATNSDTIMVKVNGSTKLNIEVTPYYLVRNAKFSISGKTVTANFKAEQIITDANAKSIERVSLYVNRTQFVDNRGSYNIKAADLSGGSIVDPNNITLSLVVPDIVPTQNYVFARVGIKIAGVEKMIFSPVQKLTLAK